MVNLYMNENLSADLKNDFRSIIFFMYKGVIIPNPLLIITNIKPIQKAVFNCTNFFKFKL